MVIRRASIDEAAALAAFATRAFAETFAAHNTPEDMATYLAKSYGDAQQRAELADSGMVTLIVEPAKAGPHREESIIGFAQVRRHPPPPCVRGAAPVELWRFYVDRPWHGAGVAQALMDGACEAARNLGGETIWLSVWERNARAIRFYAKCGFQDAGTQVFVLGSDHQTDRVMTRSLPPQRERT
jgi:ribosomal protein S18 acetylase RimI-like enzyme